MLTQEQIQKLKPGAPIVIRTSFASVDKSGNIWFNAPTHNCPLNQDVIHPDLVSLPSEHGTSVPTPEHAITFCHVVDNMVKPKCDPCRPFRKGDIVKRRTVDGRTDPDVPEDTYLTVIEDEAKYGNVRVQEPNGRRILIKWVFLELVTPVEELVPYEVDGDDFDKQYSIFYFNKLVCTYPFDTASSFYTKEQAEAAAEAECKRINEEWRKNQNHD